ncbi:MAG TPA: carboxymuconolactone decarboxylase family protein [Halioglobus sp.]
MAGRPRATNSNTPSGNMIRDSALGLVPQTLDHYMALNRHIWESGPLSPAEIEIARLRNARKVNCVFCKSVRYDIAKADGLSEERVAMIEDDFQGSALSEREKLILAFTDQYLNEPSGLSVELKEALLAEFSPEELVHLSMAVAHFNGFSRCAVALGGMPEKLPIMEMSVPR